MASEQLDGAVTGRIAAGDDYRLQVSAGLDGFLLTGSAGPVAYLSHDNTRCATAQRRMVLIVRDRRLGWELALLDEDSGREIAVARPKLRPSAYRIDDRSGRRLRLGRGLRVSRWSLASERGRIARLAIDELLRSTRSGLGPGYDERSAAEVSVSPGTLNAGDVGPLVLLAIATIRAEMTIPVLDPSPSG